MLIATLPPLARHRAEIVDHPSINGLRLNTVMPIAGSRYETVAQLQALCAQQGVGKPLWLDLKARQLRITRWADPTYSHIELSHPIRVEVPVEIHFKDHRSTIVAVEGNRIILEHPPRQAVGAGQPVNILHSSLRIEGFLTDGDRQYVETAKRLGLHTFLLSFVEQPEDLEELWSLDPEAQIVAKIESPAGIRFVQEGYTPYRDRVRLMAARDDLYSTIGRNKVDMLRAERIVLQADPQAIVASRLLTSLERNETVALGDLKDLLTLHRDGWQAFMLSDQLCLDAAVFRQAMLVYQQFRSYLAGESDVYP